MSLLVDFPRVFTAIAEWLACIIYIIPLKKRYDKFCTAGILICALAFHFVLNMITGSFPITLWIVGMVLNIIFMFLVIEILSAETTYINIYWTALAFSTAELMASAEWQISYRIIPEYRGEEGIQVYLIGIVLFVVMMGILCWIQLKYKMISKLLTTKQTLVAVLLSGCGFIFSNMYFLDPTWNATTGQQYAVFCVRTLVDLSIVIILYLLQWMMKEQGSREEIDSIQKVLHLQYKKYLDFKESSEYISRQCHDLKHQIDSLRSACSNEEREMYIQEMEKAIKLYNGQNITGNVVLDTLLTRKKIYCLQHNIDFSVMADGRLLSNMSVKDICTIMGNILDNAIEYVSTIEDEEERHIQGQIFEKNGFVMIRLENYYKGNNIDHNELPNTTKKDKRVHGYGLKSVEYITKKYNGNMTIRTENNWFIVRILLPLRTDNHADNE